MEDLSLEDSRIMLSKLRNHIAQLVHEEKDNEIDHFVPATNFIVGNRYTLAVYRDGNTGGLVPVVLDAVTDNSQHFITVLAQDNTEYKHWNVVDRPLQKYTVRDGKFEHPSPFSNTSTFYHVKIFNR